VNPKHPPGPPMTLGSMYEHGVHHLIGFCHNDALVPAAGQVRQVRGRARRCAAELEREGRYARQLERAPSRDAHGAHHFLRAIDSHVVNKLDRLRLHRNPS